MTNKNNLQTIMSSKNYTLQQLARMTGISKSTLSRIENGTTDPRQSTMIAIARGLKMEVWEVFNLQWRK